jgi:hypothetical protein
MIRIAMAPALIVVNHAPAGKTCGTAPDADEGGGFRCRPISGMVHIEVAAP